MTKIKKILLLFMLLLVIILFALFSPIGMIMYRIFFIVLKFMFMISGVGIFVAIFFAVALAQLLVKKPLFCAAKIRNCSNELVKIPVSDTIKNSSVVSNSEIIYQKNNILIELNKIVYKKEQIYQCVIECIICLAIGIISLAGSIFYFSTMPYISIFIVIFTMLSILLCLFMYLRWRKNMKIALENKMQLRCCDEIYYNFNKIQILYRQKSLMTKIRSIFFSDMYDDFVTLEDIINHKEKNKIDTKVEHMVKKAKIYFYPTLLSYGIFDIEFEE